MILAAIDMGTNSTRLFIGQSIQGEIKSLRQELETTRIGEKMAASGEIQPHILEKTINCLLRYKNLCHEYQVEKILVTATSAIRDATNQEWVCNQIFERTGLRVDVLSGPQEARLSYLGAIGSSTEVDQEKVVVDIGGGSTELIYPTVSGIQYKSVNVGAVRLKENQELLGKVPEILKGLKSPDFPAIFSLVGVGGTITTLVAIKLELEQYDGDLVDGVALSYTDVYELFEKLEKMTLAERKKLKGLEPQRADIILYGTLILMEVMRILKADTVTASEKDILQGVIITADNGQS